MGLPSTVLSHAIHQLSTPLRSYLESEDRIRFNSESSLTNVVLGQFWKEPIWFSIVKLEYQFTPTKVLILKYELTIPFENLGRFNLVD